ncbi:HK97 family phage prohead protease [Actinoplanes sp. NPDC051861]|uniref:HK97 family phage prohead protease n=1 Tax=Actinoplanes sp. NPDC051861 TaxID=3155170 RepID=UPI00343E857E
MNYERRTLPSELESRAIGNGRRLITGYAYIFDALSEPLGGFRERIMAGAGAESIVVDDIRALWDHDPKLILGRTTSGTLRLAEDSLGLHYEVEADERQSYVRDLLIALERGDVSQSSFGFRANPDGDSWSLSDDGYTPLRSVHSLSLFDVSPVTYPAYLSSTSAAY